MTEPVPTQLSGNWTAFVLSLSDGGIRTPIDRALKGRVETAIREIEQEVESVGVEPTDDQALAYGILCGMRLRLIAKFGRAK